MTTLNLQVSASADDTQKRNSGWSSAAFAFGIGQFSGVDWESSARFVSVTIAPSATINTSVLSIRAGNNDSGSTVIAAIGFEAADNPGQVTSSADFGTRRANLTTHTVAWNPIGAWTAATWFDSPDLSTSLQDIVDRAGWASGQAINLFLKNNGSTDGAFRRGTDYDASSANAPKLAITYTAAASGATGTAAGTLPHLTASATGAMQPSGTAAASLPHLTASASGTQTQSGTASASFAHLTASASGTQTQSGTAAASLPHLTASATGAQSQTGTAAASLPHLTASASGAQSYIATGTASLPHLTASATGTQTITGTIAASFPHLTASGTDAEPTSNLIDVTGSYAPIVGILGSYTPTINATGSYAPTIDVTGRAS